MPEEKKKIDDLGAFFADMDDDDTIEGEYSAQDQMIDEVLALLENHGKISGGIIRFEVILDFLRNRSYPDLDEETCFTMVKQMKKDSLIDEDFTFGDRHVYVFDSVEMDKDMVKLLETFNSTPKMSYGDITDKLQWDEVKARAIVAKYQEYPNLIKEEDGKFFVTGL